MEDICVICGKKDVSDLSTHVCAECYTLAFVEAGKYISTGLKQGIRNPNPTILKALEQKIHDFTLKEDEDEKIDISDNVNYP